MQNVHLVSQKTKAIITSDSSYYQSVVIEGDSQFYSTHKAEDIINHSCLIYGATLDGRRGAVKEILKSVSKLPIAISASKGIYMFPTASRKNKDCVWLAYYHIKEYFLHNNKTYIVFRDGKGMYVNASLNTIDNQMRRTSQIIVQLNWSVIFGEGQIRPWYGKGMED